MYVLERSLSLYLEVVVCENFTFIPLGEILHEALLFSCDKKLVDYTEKDSTYGRFY